MRPGTLARSAMRGIERYRGSAIHDRVGHSCRFTPSCSHYADDALTQRAFPLALALVAWRLLRCTPLTPYGTVDVVGVRRPGRVRRIVAVLCLSGLTTLLVAGTAAAVGMAPAQAGGGSGTEGGCDAFVGGVPIGTLTVDHPLQVHKGQHIVLTGLAPLSIRNLPSTLQLSSVTTVRIHFIEKLATTNLTENAKGQRFQRSVNVDTYLKYGSGVYRIDVHSVATPGWDCSATFYVELHGSKLAAEVAVAVGAIGAAGVVGAGHSGGEPEPEPRPDDGGTYDPAIAPDKLEKLQAPQKDRGATGLADGGVGCLAGILFALIASTGAFALATPVPSRGNPRRIWVRGRPVLGFVSGLFFGLGTTVALQQFGVYPLTLVSAVVAPLVMAVAGGWRGWRGQAWKVG